MDGPKTDKPEPTEVMVAGGFAAQAVSNNMGDEYVGINAECKQHQHEYQAADRLLRALRGEGVLPSAAVAVLARQHFCDSGFDAYWQRTPSRPP